MKSSPKSVINQDDFSPKPRRASNLQENTALWNETIKISKKPQAKQGIHVESKGNNSKNMEQTVISGEPRPGTRVGLLADDHYVFRKHPHIQLSSQEYENFHFNAVEMQNKARRVCENVAECSEYFEIDASGDVITPISVEKFELCTLADVIRARNSLNIKWRTNELWNLMTQLVDILATLQKHLICHRDIKPANILVDETLKNYKLTNFGVACELSHSQVEGSEAVSLPTQGTLGYADPVLYDALMSKQEYVKIVPVKSDVYSLGRLFDSILKEEDSHDDNQDIKMLVERLLNFDAKERPTFIELKQMLEDKPHRVGEVSSDDIKKITLEVLKYYWASKVKVETASPNVAKPADASTLENYSNMLDILSTKMLNTLQLAPEDYAQRLNNLATALWLDNRNELAAHTFEMVRSFQESKHHTDNALYATALKGLGDALLDLEEYDESLHHHVKSSLLWSRLNGTNDKEYADALYGIGSALLYKGDYTSAIQYLTQAVRCRRSVGANLQLGFTLVRLGDALHLNGEPERARECCEEAGQLQKRICGEDHPEYAVTLGLLGDLLAESGEHKAALERLTQAASIQRTLKGNRSSDLAVVLQSIGKVYQMMGEYPKAAEYMSESLNMEKELQNEKSDSFAIGVYNLGTVFHDMKEYKKAIKCYEEAMDISLPVLGEHHAIYMDFHDKLDEARYDLERKRSEEMREEKIPVFHEVKSPMKKEEVHEKNTRDR